MTDHIRYDAHGTAWLEIMPPPGGPIPPLCYLLHDGIPLDVVRVTHTCRMEAYRTDAVSLPDTTGYVRTVLTRRCIECQRPETRIVDAHPASRTWRALPEEAL